MVFVSRVSGRGDIVEARMSLYVYRSSEPGARAFGYKKREQQASLSRWRGPGESFGREKKQKKHGAHTQAERQRALEELSHAHRLFISHRFSFTDAVTTASVASNRSFSDMTQQTRVVASWRVFVYSAAWHRRSCASRWETTRGLHPSSPRVAVCLTTQAFVSVWGVGKITESKCPYGRVAQSSQ